MGLSKEYAAAAHLASADAAVADAAYLDSVDWVASSDCPCCNGGHTRRAGFLFKQWLQELQEVDGVRQWAPHALAVLQVCLNMNLRPCPRSSALTPCCSA